jgi:drug/metabolite transporter (DMT)-like permease
MNHKHNNSNLGALYITLCCFSSAASFVFIAHLNQSHNELLSMALTFGYAIILFSLFNIKKLSSMFKIMLSQKRAMLGLNIATLFSWFGTFMALKYIDPATKISIGFGLIAVTNFFIATPLRSIGKNKHLLLCILFVMLNMGLVIGQYAVSSVHVSTEHMLFGLAWSVVGGIIGGFIGINSQRLHKAGYTATQVLATRFYFLVIVSVLILLFTARPTPLHIHWQYYLLSTALVVLLPLLMYHLAIESLGALIVSFVEPFTPVLTYFIQVIVLHYRFNLLTMVLLTLSSGGIILLVRMEHRSKGSNKPRVDIEHELEQALG